MYPLVTTDLDSGATASLHWLLVDLDCNFCNLDLDLWFNLDSALSLDPNFNFNFKLHRDVDPDLHTDLNSDLQTDLNSDLWKLRETLLKKNK